MKTLNMVVLILVVIGGLNWGLVGLFDFNVVGAIFGETAARAIYVIVGIAAIWALTFFRVLSVGADVGRPPTAAQQ
ncbi:MAG: DUF378 domain-containing protein [Armatimonadota bacterium]